jgi:hypothetical protein
MRSPLLLLICVAAFGSVGCGGSGTVSGKVTYQGETLRAGQVCFITADGKKSDVATISADGTYSIANIPTGEVKICVLTSYLAKTKSHPRPGADSQPSDLDTGHYRPPSSSDASKRFVPIPSNYEGPETTTLKYTVKSGKQEHNIVLEGTADAPVQSGGGPPSKGGTVTGSGKRPKH